MGEYVRGVPMVFIRPEEESLGAAAFPFDLIGSFVPEQDIPRYRFDMERRVKKEIADFRDEMEMRTIHQMYQRRMQPRHRSQQKSPAPPAQDPPRPPPPMPRATSTPVGSLASLPAATAAPHRAAATVVHFDGAMGAALEDDDDGSRDNGTGSNATNIVNLPGVNHSGYGAPLLRIAPDTIKTRLPPIKKPEEPRPMTSRIKSLFRSKPRPTSSNA
ncbi:hypothetical protein H4R18_003986 [Coemansia javaensis]|uniref:Uncharacterized protein n=1 Tax=Coemansia javaensis TaxID=2761396 RepID=A0A9W8LGH2_9FUNG|nr:hypothetical protein H4R18_003986 [Coemansia javaensis]